MINFKSIAPELARAKLIEVHILSYYKNIIDVHMFLAVIQYQLLFVPRINNKIKYLNKFFHVIVISFNVFKNYCVIAFTLLNIIMV